ncbi:MAG TPA: OsmC family protein [Kofleriaceae bacterium]|nr:OsmC family protein [Kofleriaceae bacterium]
MKRNAKAIWKGSVTEGSGHLTTQSGAVTDVPYSAKLRFQNEDGKAGTNPEELIAAAHAGCFAMALSARLTANGTPPEQLEADAAVELVKKESGWAIPSIQLTVHGKVPGLDDKKFQELAADAKANCPVSKVLAGAEITLTATLSK